MNLKHIVIVALVAVFLTGCGSAIDHGPFISFAASTTELRDNADEVLILQYNWARERFIQETTEGDSISEENVQKLILENVPDKPFAWMAPEPQLLFLAARQFRETVGELNDALVQYAELLAELAIAGHLDENEFKATAAGIDSGLSNAAMALGDPDHNQEIAIFSTGATELFRQYLDTKSKDKLRDALNENQENILAVSNHLRDAMRLASQHTFAEYSPRSLDLALMLTPDSGLSNGQKKDRVVELIELNELLIKRLDILRRLDDSYRALPGANQELARSLDNSESGLASIYRIRDNAKQLQELYKELESRSSDTSTESNGG